MTFPDVGENKMSPKETKAKDVSQALKEALTRAKEEQRITCGIYASAKLLEVAPESVTLCLLPVDCNTKDVTIVMLHTLVEAYCWENEIRLLKVDSSDKLGTILSEFPRAGQSKMTSDIRMQQTDFSCVLLQYPDEEYRCTDHVITEYYNKLMNSSIFPCPVIELPV